MLKVKVGRIGIIDTLKFKNLPDSRDKVIESTPDKPIVTEYRINENSKALHPDYVMMRVAARREHGKAGAVTYTFTTPDGKPFPFFRAGQYVVVSLSGGSRPYSISSSPKEALEGKVEITVKDTDGYFPTLLRKELEVGSLVKLSAPQGTFHYHRLRDARHVVAVAGGSGITPFLSMAKAITEGSEDFSLTILFGSRTYEGILLKDELESCVCDKVKVVHVLSHEEKEGSLSGFITPDLIRREGGEDYSLFVCGPEGLYNHMKKEEAALGLPDRKLRYEIQGVSSSFREKLEDKVYSILVRQCGREKRIAAHAKESILVALEKGGIKAPSRCRGGECGWCRSRLLSGEVKVAVERERRRFQDKMSRVIHPCVTYPLSDLVIEVPGEY